MRRLLARALASLLLLAAGRALAASPEVPPDAPADLTPVRKDLEVLSDGKGHYVALVPFGRATEHVYWGDGKTFHALRVISSGINGTERFDLSFWDPRIFAGYKRSVGFGDGKYEVWCDERKTQLKPLSKPERDAMLDAAKFWKPRWKRQAYALAHDESGNYFYVDRLREGEAIGFRLFAGPKGALRPLKMTNVVSDSEGDIFATKRGELRLILQKSEYTWVKGKARTKLVAVPLEKNGRLIYEQLGVYAGEPLGTPCDAL